MPKIGRGLRIGRSFVLAKREEEKAMEKEKVKQPAKREREEQKKPINNSYGYIVK